MGSRKESIPPDAWTESGRTPVLGESSNSRMAQTCECASFARSEDSPDFLRSAGLSDDNSLIYIRCCARDGNIRGLELASERAHLVGESFDVLTSCGG